MKNRRRNKTVPMKVLKEPFAIVDIDDLETVCRVCDAEFLDEEDLQLHVAQVHLYESDGKTICNLCCTAASNAEELVTHLIFKHFEHCKFCFYCYRAFLDPVLFDQHELKHCATDDFIITCSQCPSIYSSRQMLQKHEFNEHGNSTDGYMFNDFFPLLSSALSMSVVKFFDCLCQKKQFVCRKCNHSTHSIKNYIEHLKTLNCQCFACDKCYNVYKKKYSIAHHMQKEPQCHNYVIEKENRKLCPKCKKYFDIKYLNEHKKFCNIIKCLSCNKEFSSMDELTGHRNEEHQLSISLKVCKFCNKEFVGKISLKKHMLRTHKNKNLYKYRCVHCGMIFTHPSKLFAHYFSRHKNINPYTCSICKKCFRLRKHFTFHIKLQHKSIGFVEFDENFHVNFTDKKPGNPVKPQYKINMDSTTDTSDMDCNQTSQDINKEQPRSKDVTLDTTQSTIVDKLPHNLKGASGNTKFVSKKAYAKARHKQKQRRVKPGYKKLMATDNSEQLSSENSDNEPLSNIRESLLTHKYDDIPNLNKRMAIRDKKAKLTCKICNKYCYTVQNYHHHMTLHEKTKLKRCIKCQQYFKTKQELRNHINSTHSSSKLIETLKLVMEKRKNVQTSQKPDVTPGQSLKNLLEKRKRAQKIMNRNSAINKFRRTIKRVDVTDDCKAIITPMSDHGLSVKNFIENFKPEIDNINISNSVTIKALSDLSMNKEPLIKMQKFNPEPQLPLESDLKLTFPIKFKDPPVDYIDSKVSVRLVQQLITKPKPVNMIVNERIPVVQDKTATEYCNMFADETDYTQYKNDTIPEVAHEVMLGDPEDIPRTRRLAQEIIIPKIPKEHGEVRIGHLLPQAPFFKIVKVKKLLEPAKDPDTDAAANTTDKDVKLPDGTRLISVKNPYSHLIPNEHLQALLKATRSKYYTPKTNNIESAVAKALSDTRSSRHRKVGKRARKN